MVSFVDIPWEIIVNFIAPQLTAKEFGVLAMQNKFLRDLFMFNDKVWMDYMLRTDFEHRFRRDRCYVTEIIPMRESYPNYRLETLSKIYSIEKKKYKQFIFRKCNNLDIIKCIKIQIETLKKGAIKYPEKPQKVMSERELIEYHYNEHAHLNYKEWCEEWFQVIDIKKEIKNKKKELKKHRNKKVEYHHEVSSCDRLINNLEIAIK